MGRILYVIVMAFVRALAGVATDAHKGAVFAAVVGFFWMFFMAISFARNWGDTDTATPYARVLSLIVFWASLPIALVAWGNQAVTGGGALLTIFWFAVAAVVIRLLALAAYGIEKKWGTG